MTTFIESVSVEVQCAAYVGPVFPIAPCPRKGRAVIVSTVERGDLVLMPIGWETTAPNGQIEVFCPDHQMKES
jgi:hypothetical protein